MRTTILAVIAALAFTGVAQADDINTITLNGIIVGGDDSGPNGTNDDAGLFGGGDLLNAPITVTVSYDATFVQNNFTYTNDGVGYSQTSLQGNIPDDVEVGSPFQINITVGDIPLGVTGTFNDDIFLCSASDVDLDCSNYGGIAAIDSLGDMIQVYFLNSDSALAGYDVNNPSDVSAAFNDPNNVYSFFVVYGPSGNDAYDNLMFDQPTPEPSTWLLLITGLGGMATLRFRRGAVSQ